MPRARNDTSIRQRTTKALCAFAALIMLTGMNTRLGGLEPRVLAAHNAERESLGLAPMVWDRKLALSAAGYARELAHNGQFRHSANVAGQPLEGENLWRGTAGAFTPEHMVERWIAEKQHFRIGKFPFTTTTGDVGDVSHYTQIVWRQSRHVGCAIARADGKEVLVCRYSKPGNVIGQTVY